MIRPKISYRKLHTLVKVHHLYLLSAYFLAGPPQRVLSSFLHSFVESGRAGVPFRPAALPVLGLSKGDKQCIRDRSYIMARHMFADKSEEYIHSQVRHCLSLWCNKTDGSLWGCK